MMSPEIIELIYNTIPSTHWVPARYVKKNIGKYENQYTPSEIGITIINNLSHVVKISQYKKGVKYYIRNDAKDKVLNNPPSYAHDAYIKRLSTKKKYDSDLPIFKKLGISNRARYKAIELLGLECVRCGFSDIRALQIDHIDGKGYIERKIKGSHTIYKNIVEDKEYRKNFQVLCANCNNIKKFVNKEYPFKNK